MALVPRRRGREDNRIPYKEGNPSQPVPVVTARSYTPGHWGQTNQGSDNQSVMQAMLTAAPTLKGFLKRWYWNELETGSTEGTASYTLNTAPAGEQSFLSDLQWCYERGVKYIPMIMDKSFDTDSSNGANPLPAYMSTYAFSNNTGGYTTLRWQSYPRTRLKLLHEAILTQAAASGYGSALEGIATQETSIGLSNPTLTGATRVITAATAANPAVFTSSVAHTFAVNQLVTLASLAGGTWSGLNGTTARVASTPSTTTFTLTGVSGVGRGTYTASSGTGTSTGVGYSATIYADSYIEILTHLSSYAPTKRAFWFMNFISGGNSQIDRVISTVAPYKVVMAGPDLWPTSAQGDGLRDNIYPKYAAHKDEVPLGIGISVPSYTEQPTVENGDVTEDGAMSMEDVFLYGRDNLHIQYCFWMNRPTGTRNFPAHGAAVVAEYPTFNVESW